MTETDTDRLRMQLADAQVDLQRHSTALSKLQDQFMLSRHEVFGIRDDLRAAEAHIGELRVHAANREAEITRLRQALTDLSTVHEEMRASRAWRVAAAVSRAGSYLLHKRS